MLSMIILLTDGRGVCVVGGGVGSVKKNKNKACQSP